MVKPNKQPTTQQQRSIATGVIIFLAALIIRIWYLHESSANPTFWAPIVDSYAYDSQARSLVGGGGLTGGFFWQPVFYQLFLSLTYLASNSSILFAKIVQIILGAATCLLTYKLADRIFDRRVGITAGLVTALYGPLIFFETELLAAGWAAFWSVALIWMFLHTQERKAIWLYLALGVCGALSVLTRPTFLPFVVASSIWLAVVSSKTTSGIRRAGPRLAALLAGFLVVVLPVSAANQHVTGHFGFLPASGGLNMYIGNNPDPAGTLTVRIGEDWTELQRLPVRHGVNGLWAEQRYFLERVGDRLRSDPLGFAGNIARKAGQIASSREIPRNVDLYLFREWSPLLRVLTWKIGPWGFPFGLLLPLAAAGLVLCRRRIPKPLLLFLVFYPLSIVLVFVSARYRVAVIPVLAVVASAGALALIDKTRSWNALHRTAVAACAVGIVLVSTLPDPFGQEGGNYKAEMYYGVGCAKQNAGRDREAIASFMKAIRLDPDYAEAHLNLANVLITIPRWDDAFTHYRKALAIRPGYADAHFSLGVALYRRGNTKDAIAHFEEALRSQPDHWEAHFNLGLTLHMTGDNAAAVTHLEEAVRLMPESAEAHYILGVVLNEQRKEARAVAEYREALRQNPDWPDALNSLASLLATTDKPELRNSAAAIKLAERACQLTGFKSPLLLETLALANLSAGRVDEAKTIALRAAELARSAGQDDLAHSIETRFHLDVPDNL